MLEDRGARCVGGAGFVCAGTHIGQEPAREPAKAVWGSGARLACPKVGGNAGTTQRGRGPLVMVEGSGGRVGTWNRI